MNRASREITKTTPDALDRSFERTDDDGRALLEPRDLVRDGEVGDQSRSVAHPLDGRGSVINHQGAGGAPIVGQPVPIAQLWAESLWPARGIDVHLERSGDPVIPRDDDRAAALGLR